MANPHVSPRCDVGLARGFETRTLKNYLICAHIYAKCPHGGANFMCQIPYQILRVVAIVVQQLIAA